MTLDQNIFQLQTDLLALGIDPGPIDGLVGLKTRSAAHTAAQRYGLMDFTKIDIPLELMKEIHQLAERERQPLVYPANYVDASQDSAAGWREGYRPLKDIVGFVLHQTGCPLPEVSEAELKEYKTSGEFSRPKTPALLRWCKTHSVDAKTGKAKFDAQGRPLYVSLKTHFGITYRGVILQVHPLDVWGWSSQGGSRNYLNIEIAGLFAGIEGNSSTRPNAPESWKIQSVTDAQVEACLSLIRFLTQYLRDRGARIQFIKGHRQFTNDRDPDPGGGPNQFGNPGAGGVWGRIVKPLHQELGLTDGGIGWVMGKGHKIPDAWTGGDNGFSY